MRVLVEGFHRLKAEMAKFGTVGLLAFITDFVGWNLLVHGPIGPTEGPMRDIPTWASVVSTAAGTLVSWVGNTFWTYRHQKHENQGKAFVLFVVFNVIGLVITAACLWISLYVLRLDNLFVNNLARFIGIGLGTIFRFWSYRNWVFPAKESDAIA